MTDIKEIKLVDVKNNSNIINNLNSIYKLWGYDCLLYTSDAADE